MQVLYATACCGDHTVGDGSFTPLQVNYAERFSAAGRTRSVARILLSENLSSFGVFLCTMKHDVRSARQHNVSYNVS